MWFLGHANALERAVPKHERRTTNAPSLPQLNKQQLTAKPVPPITKRKPGRSLQQQQLEPGPNEQHQQWKPR